MIEGWKSAIDSCDMVGSVAINLSEAFDNLPHGLLIAKIHAYGVTLSSCELIANYLHNRKQRIKSVIKEATGLMLNVVFQRAQY